MDFEIGKEYHIEFKPTFSAALGGNHSQSFIGELVAEDEFGYLTFRKQGVRLGPVPPNWIVEKALVE